MKKFIVLVCLIGVLTLSACSQMPAPTTEATEAGRGRWLDISAEVVPENPKPTTDLTVPGTERTISHKGLIDPKILIDGTYVPLDKAVESGQLTPEQVIYYAMMDAAEDNCSEFCYTENGLTQFVYVYGDYDVWVVRDVFQTPSKGDHLIKQVLICDHIDKNNLSNGSFEDKNGELLGIEDWGLEFEVAEVTSTGMTLHITQSGGQHMGKLHITRFTMIPYEWTGEGEMPTDFGGYPVKDSNDLYMIENDAVTQLHLSWEEHGVLASGSYQLRLFVKDEFDAKDAHQLTRDYMHSQGYTLENIIIP